MSATTHAILLTVFALSSCVWVGGYVAIAVVARVATKTLDPGQRVAFFRGLGRSYIRLGVPALVVAFGTGVALLTSRPWDAVTTAAAVVAVALVGSLAFGVVQARRMTRLRVSALARPDDQHAAQKVRQGARSAGLLRATIGLLSLTLVVLGSVLAS